MDDDTRTGRRIGVYAALATAALVALTVLGVLAAFAFSGLQDLLMTFNPWADEWHCVEGEAPILRDKGPGSACHPEGEPLPDGWRWDPKGNRPLGE